jgi:putative membrane protein
VKSGPIAAATPDGPGKATSDAIAPIPMAAPIPLQLAALKQTNSKRAALVILAASAAALALLVGVIYGHGRAEHVPEWVTWLPGLNALLNATSASFLVLAYRAIRRRDVATHARRVLVSLGASTLFLASYIAYHAAHGDTRFGGHGIARPLYFFVLITHVGLSALVLPLVFLTLFFSLSGRFRQHRSIARYTLPVWLYVSVTGVLVYAMLRLFG